MVVWRSILIYEIWMISLTHRATIQAPLPSPL
jgi:hypothetical protein